MISKQDLTTTNVERVSGTEHVARIKESPKAFHILSGALYSDKILAVVRELSCNAYDAHVDSGKKDIPFEVKLPTSWESTFYVKDYGPGLSEDQVYNLYMTYFESTKASSNDVIGMLGLGSKSPFSYGTTFTVESRQGGVKKIYTCYLNESRCPAVSKLGEAATDEPDGLTVALPVHDTDRHKFVTAAETALTYFDPPPKIVGASASIIKTEHVREGTNWKVRSPKSRWQGVRVVQGFISYPVDWSYVIRTVSKNFTERERGILSSVGAYTTQNIDLYVPIGEVEIAPSREALTYDDQTCMVLAKSLIKCATDIVSELIAAVEKAPTLWQAYQIWDQRHTFLKGDDDVWKLSLYGHEFINLNGTPCPTKLLNEGIKVFEAHRDGSVPRTTWAPTTISILTVHTSLTRGKFNNPRRPPTQVLGVREKNNPMKQHVTSLEWTIKPNGSYVGPVIVDDTDGKTSLKTVQYNIWTHGPTDGIEVVVDPLTGRKDRFKSATFIKAAPGTTIDPLELKVLLKKMGNPPVIKVSELLPFPKQQTGTYKPRPKTKARLLVSAFSGSPKCWSDVDIDVENGSGYYVRTHRWDVVDKNGVPYDFEIGMGRVTSLGRVAVMFGALAEDWQANLQYKGIVGVSEAQAKSLGPGWVEYVPHVINEMKKCEAKIKDMIDASSALALTSSAGSAAWIALRFVNNWQADYAKCPELMQCADILKKFSGMKRPTVAFNELRDMVKTYTDAGFLPNGFANVDKPFELEIAAQSFVDAYPKLMYLNIYEAVRAPDGVELIKAALNIV